MLPARLQPVLRDQLKVGRAYWECDWAAKLEGVRMPDALERSNPRAEMGIGRGGLSCNILMICWLRLDRQGVSLTDPGLSAMTSHHRIGTRTCQEFRSRRVD